MNTRDRPSGMSRGSVGLPVADPSRLRAELDWLAAAQRVGLSRRLVRTLRVGIVAGWQQYAACAGADPEAWFPCVQGAAVPRPVVRICADCPVRRSCLATALLWSVDGLWAGTTLQDRQKTLRQLRAGEPVEQVLTVTLDAAAGRVRTPSRDWFHVKGSTPGEAA